MKKLQFKPRKCECCGQSMEYILGLDKGTAHIVKQFARFISEKGINIANPNHELKNTWLTDVEVGNITRATAHGLLARVDGDTGNYALTNKGQDFLRGSVVPKYAIMSKVDKRQIGYLEEYTVTVHELDKYWEGINYEIKQGRVIKNLDGENPTIRI